MSVAVALLAGWAAAAVVMALLWLLQRRTGDAGIVDVAWAAGVGILAAYFAWTSDGLVERRWMIAAMAGLWAARLAGYLLVPVLRLPEDGRYRQMREEWGEKSQANLFGFFQVQAFWSVLFAAPMWLAMRNAEPLGWTDFAGLTIFLIALGGETIADRQLGRFRNDPSTKGQVCKGGLWRYSRHPNYFFEWIHWWAYVLIGWAAPWGYLTLAGPVVMLFFLIKVTGIPPTEANALRSRGDADREYQRTTSVFFPWPPKEELT